MFVAVVTIIAALGEWNAVVVSVFRKPAVILITTAATVTVALEGSVFKLAASLMMTVGGARHATAAGIVSNWLKCFRTKTEAVRPRSAPVVCS